MPALAVNVTPLLACVYSETTRPGVFLNIHLTPSDMSQAVKAIICKLLALSFSHGTRHTDEDTSLKASGQPLVTTTCRDVIAPAVRRLPSETLQAVSVVPAGCFSWLTGGITRLSRYSTSDVTYSKTRPVRQFVPGPILNLIQQGRSFVSGTANHRAYDALYSLRQEHE